MMEYPIAISDSLLKELFNYKHAKEFDKKKIEALFHFYKPPFLTNLAQLQRIEIKDPSLLQKLAQQSWCNESLEDLSKRTTLKVVLSDNSDNFPMVNVFNGKFQNNYSITHYKKDSREKSKQHLKALLNEAKDVLIYDKYFSLNWKNTKAFFEDLAPRKIMTFYYKENHLTQNNISEAKRICNSWKFQIDNANENYSHLHDRYLVIDRKLEIILTSGIENLFLNSMDLTYIVRRINV